MWPFRKKVEPSPVVVPRGLALEHDVLVELTGRIWVYTNTDHTFVYKHSNKYVPWLSMEQFACLFPEYVSRKNREGWAYADVKIIGGNGNLSLMTPTDIRAILNASIMTPTEVRAILYADNKPIIHI